MAKILYDTAAKARLQKNADHMAIITKANTIIESYQAQGFDLTLRQLYYQFVSREIIPNTDREYKKLGGILNDARMAGLVDWEAIVDRTRHLRELSHWDSPDSIISACASQYRVDLWDTQPNRVEVWIEKDALIGVISGVCEELDVPYFSCRGYTSVSELWSASQRLKKHNRRGQQSIILHFGDHDPSGIDMTRDITDRLNLFGVTLDVRRLALNMDQVEEYSPPPNPAKVTDSRAQGYIALHGDESWELDALEPAVLANLIRDEIATIREDGLWKDKLEEQNQGRERLRAVSDRWDDVVDFVEKEEE